MPAILWPDVEALTVGHLRAALAARTEPYAAGVVVSNRVPAARADRMVIVRDDGGPALDDVRAVARIGVRVWGGTYEDATDLANLCVALVAAMPGQSGLPFSRSDVSRPAEVPDPSEQPLRYFTAELVVRGDSL